MWRHERSGRRNRRYRRSRRDPRTRRHAREAMGFVIGDFGFLYPDMDLDKYPDMENTDFGEEGVRGFDLDSQIGGGSEPAACPHADYNAPDGTPGIDYGLWSFIRQYEPMRQNQLIDSVISSAVKNGEMSIVMELDGVDDLVNDDEVTVQIFSTQDSPPRRNGRQRCCRTELSRCTPTRRTTARSRLARSRTACSWRVPSTWGSSSTSRSSTRPWSSPTPGFASPWVTAPPAESFQATGRSPKSTKSSVTPPPTMAPPAGFDYDQFWTAMEAADAGYDEASGECTLFTTVFRLDAVTAFLTD